MRKKSLLILLSLLLVGSCSTNEETNRELASKKGPETKEEKDADYWKHRGKDWTKFSYDGYTGKKNKFKFIGAVTSPKNLKMSKVLSGRRQDLLEENLFDTGVNPNKSLDCDKIMKRVHRSPYGECYFHNYEEHLSDKDKKLANQLRMGALNERFGRNITTEDAAKAEKQDLMKPSPIEISQRLLARKGKQIDAPVINVLATAWLQAMNHDWFSHGKNSKKKSYHVNPHKSHGDFKDGMKIPHSREETDKEASHHKHGYGKTFRNQVTHWWDASQIYGSDPATIRKVRSEYDSNGRPTGKYLQDGKVAVDKENRKMIYGEDKLPITGFHDNWWTGLEMIHTIFHLEHNSIIDNILKPQITPD